MQCYRKNDRWAACKQSCTPGADMTDWNARNWSCEKLGKRRPGRTPPLETTLGSWVGQACSGPGHNCYRTGCCASKGHQCYVKRGEVAMCKPECIPGPDPADNDSRAWSCSEVGPRTPGRPGQPAARPAAWVAGQCSQDGEDCRRTQCCASGGARCFERDGGHARCRASCVPGPDLRDTDPSPWTCRKLGLRTPGVYEGREGKLAKWVESKCSQPGQNCAGRACCAWAGMQCFKKHDSWASCRYHCRAGPDPTDLKQEHWNCTALGPRTPGKVVLDFKQKVAPWVAGYCAKPGENCLGSRCCAEPGEQCYEKNAAWGLCRSTCIPGPDPTDGNSEPWSCRKLGFRTPGEAKERSANIRAAAWVKMECASSGDNCHSTRCCAENGQQCYMKNDFWAVCSHDCKPGKDDQGEEWSCGTVGMRTPAD